jgi:hypothetical protein
LVKTSARIGAGYSAAIRSGKAADSALRSARSTPRSARNDAARLKLPGGQNTQGRHARFARRANLPQAKLLPVAPNQWLFGVVPSPLKGRFAIVTSVGFGMRWTRWRRQTSDADTVGEGVWSWHSNAGVKRAR